MLKSCCKARRVPPKKAINPESVKFWQLVEEIESELQSIISKRPSVGSSSDLFEVFCGPDSQLTSQAIVRGMKAVRFGYNQTDLSTPQGRQVLFEKLIVNPPRHLWYSPECGPWSAWSQFNGSVSVACL